METELILKSRRAVPARLLEHGFTVTYPDWRGAARDLCRQSTIGRDNALAA
jgi:NAD dependent epimerase/dehydratase family enzyme